MKTLKIDKDTHRDLKRIAILFDITLQELIHLTLKGVVVDYVTSEPDEFFIRDRNGKKLKIKGDK